MNAPSISPIVEKFIENQDMCSPEFLDRNDRIQNEKDSG